MSGVEKVWIVWKVSDLFLFGLKENPIHLLSYTMKYACSSKMRSVGPQCSIEIIGKVS